MSYSFDTIRTRIQTVLEGVTGVVNVHDYRRRAVNTEQFYTLFLDENTEKLHGWQIYIEGWDEELENFGGGGFGETTVVKYRFKVSGMYALEDETESEKVFNDLVGSIATAFNTDATLQSYVLDNSFRVVKNVEFSYIQFGDVLVHLVEISLEFKEELDE